MSTELIERATVLANKGVQKDDGYRYSVPASDLVEYAAVIHELIAELTRRGEALESAWASYLSEHGYSTYPTQPDTGADFAAGFEAGAALAAAPVSLEAAKAETITDPRVSAWFNGWDACSIGQQRFRNPFRPVSTEGDAK